MIRLVETEELKTFLQSELKSIINECLNEYFQEDKYITSTELYNIWGVGRTTGVKIKKRLIEEKIISEKEDRLKLEKDLELELILTNKEINNISKKFLETVEAIKKEQMKLNIAIVKIMQKLEIEDK